MLQNNSKDNKLEIQDLGRIPVSEISDWQKMFEKYGTQWAFQYSAEEWDSWKKDPTRAWFMETEIPFEE